MRDVGAASSGNSSPAEFTLDEIRARLAMREPALARPAAGVGQAAVAAILEQPPGARLEMLFIKRSVHPHDPWSGQMGFPGGRRDPADASAQAAAERETFEEIGVDLQRCARLLGRLDDIQAVARGRLLPLIIAPFVYHIIAPYDVRLNHEVVELARIPLITLLDHRQHQTRPYDFQGQTIQLPCVRHGGWEVWGLTYRMLALLSRALRPDGPQLPDGVFISQEFTADR